MAVLLGDAAAEAAKHALKMGSAAAGAIAFMADLGEELPFLEPVFKTIKAIREKVETVKRNRQELTALEERCTYIAACVIEKNRRMPTSEMDVTPLKNCVEAVATFVELCGTSSRRGRLRRLLKASDDKGDIAGLNARVDRLTGDLKLAGIVTVEGKVDNLRAFLEVMAKSHAVNQEKLIANQESFTRRQESFKRRQEAFGERLPKLPGKLANTPKGTPASKGWHVERRQVIETAVEALTEGGGPRLVGLVGYSGSGKTTAASDIIRSTEVREAFHDGIVWMSINQGANKRVPSLMMQLARTIYEDIGGSVGCAPVTSDDGVAYIKQRMEDGHFGKGLKCLVVADNVWENEVVLKLLETGMWVLISTRDEELVKGAQGDVVGVHELSMADAKSVLRSAAEISPDVDLPDDAVAIIDLCGRVAMDLAFVGRWSTVRGRYDRRAWSDAADKIRTEIDKVKAESESDGMESTQARRRKAILRAGFDDLAVGSDDMRVPRLYLSLSVMPDGHAFTVNDAAVLLCNLAPSAEDVFAAHGVLEQLERWTVVRLTEGIYRMHDAHSNFARERLLDRGDVRRPALERWIGYISSLDALRSINAFDLKEIWLAVKRIGGDDWDKSHSYTAALDVMGESDPLLRQTVEAVGDWQEAQEDWEAASNTWRRLLEVEKRELGPDHSFVLNTYDSLADCANRLGHATEAAEWRKKLGEALPSALARIQFHLDAGSVQGANEAGGLHHVGRHISRWAPDHRPEEESMLRAFLAAQEADLGRTDMQMATTLHSLGACVRLAGRLEEAEVLLRRSLVIKEAKLGRDDMQGAVTLHEMGVCVLDAGRLEEADALLRRCLAIKKARLGEEDIRVAVTLHELGVCVGKIGQLEEAEELLRRCLVIEKTNLRREDVQVAYTFLDLGHRVGAAGRLDGADMLVRRCLEIEDADMARKDMQRATTLHELGVCVRKAGRLEEAEEVLRSCLANKEAQLGGEDIRVAVTLHELSVCIGKAGRREEAEELLRRCLVIEDTNRGRDDAQVSCTCLDRAHCVGAARRLDEAELLLRRCLEIEQAEMGRERVQVSITLHDLGACVRGAARLREAEELLRRSLVIKEATLDREGVGVAITMRELGVCVRDTGRLEEAEQLLRRCLGILETNLGEANVQVATTMRELGVCVRDTGRPEEAEELLRRCLAILDIIACGDDVGVAHTLHELGSCARNTGRLEEAEELLRLCIGIKEVNLGREGLRMANTFHELGVCVREAGRVEEADELLGLYGEGECHD